MGEAMLLKFCTLDCTVLTLGSRNYPKGAWLGSQDHFLNSGIPPIFLKRVKLTLHIQYTVGTW